MKLQNLGIIQNLQNKKQNLCFKANNEIFPELYTRVQHRHVNGGDVYQVIRPGGELPVYSDRSQIQVLQPGLDIYQVNKGSVVKNGTKQKVFLSPEFKN